jgi:hypothetical protein
MPKHVVKKYRIYTNGRDASGDYNRVDLKAEVDELESTTVNSSGDKSFQPGLKAVRFEGEVFATLGAGEVEEAAHALLAAGGKVMTVYPSEDAGGAGYGFEAEEIAISPAMKIGDMSRITIKASKSGGALVRVTSMEGEATKTSSGTGTARELSAMTAAQTLYSFLQVLSITAGASITVTVKSDSAEGFASPVTQITHTAFSDEGAEVKSDPGPNTDTWYRVDWTITGSSPSVTFDLGLGII